MSSLQYAQYSLRELDHSGLTRAPGKNVLIVGREDERTHYKANKDNMLILLRSN